MNDDDAFKSHRKTRIKHEIVWSLVYLDFAVVFYKLVGYFVDWLILVFPGHVSTLELPGVDWIVWMACLIISLVSALKITHILLGTFELQKLS